MKTPQFEIDQLNEVLNGENIEFLRDSVAFGVAHCIVKYSDPGLLVKFPSWISDLVLGICESYRQHGSYGSVSNLGEADHSEMVSKLVKLLERE